MPRFLLNLRALDSLELGTATTSRFNSVPWPLLHTEDAGLPYFDRAAVIANGNWYYASAFESMGAKLCFRYCLVNIGPRYK